MTNTVSACNCICHIGSHASESTEGKLIGCGECKYTGKFNERKYPNKVTDKCTPTHSPTETVSDCCGATFHNSHPELTDIPTCDKCGEACITRTNPPTEPTVEKWEGEFLNDALVHDILGNLFCAGWTSSLPGIKDTSAKIPMETAKSRLITAIRPYLAHSVQEAKAEVIYKALDEIGNVNAANALSKGEAKWEFKNGLDCAKAILNHLLASLKQEEEKA